MNVGKITADINNIISSKKTQARENALLSYIVKAVARDQEKNSLISKLERENGEKSEHIDLLEAEDNVKEDLLKLKNKELESLKKENEKLRTLLHRAEENLSKFIVGDKGISKICNNNNKYNSEVVSTVNNVAGLQSDEEDNDEMPTNSPVVSTTNNERNGPGKATVTRKPSVKRSRISSMSNMLYNLRKRNK